METCAFRQARACYNSALCPQPCPLHYTEGNTGAGEAEEAKEAARLHTAQRIERLPAPHLPCCSGLVGPGPKDASLHRAVLPSADKGECHVVSCRPLTCLHWGCPPACQVADPSFYPGGWDTSIMRPWRLGHHHLPERCWSSGRAVTL